MKLNNSMDDFLCNNLILIKPCNKISNLFKTPWLLHRVFDTSSGDIDVIRLLDKSAKHNTGSP